VWLHNTLHTHLSRYALASAKSIGAKSIESARGQIGDCARAVHESNVFISLDLAVSEKQIPLIIENIGNQNS
jgi:hypothetical protein